MKLEKEAEQQQNIFPVYLQETFHLEKLLLALIQVTSQSTNIVKPKFRQVGQPRYTEE